MPAADGPITTVFHAQGHLIDSGLLSDVLDAVVAPGATYRVLRLDVGTSREGETLLELEVTAPSHAVYERLSADLMSLGVSETVAESVQLAAVVKPGVAPETFYSSTNLETRIHVGKRWVLVEDQRMDAAIVVEPGGERARCVKLRDLTPGQQVVVGFAGIQLTPSTAPRRGSKFEFMAGGISSERNLDAQVEQVVRVWREVRDAGQKVVLVVGPVVVHVGAVPHLVALLRAGLVDGLLAGNALAVHDCEAAMFGTSLGVGLENGRPVVHGHMHHMRAINRIRAAGGLRQAVEQGVLTSGVMHAAIQSRVPYSLAGSIRDDGPIPDTRMDLIAAQDDYARLLRDAGLVVILGSMLHGIGVGNMIPASVRTVCVDIHPAVVAKLSDRGSAQSSGIVTDVGGFLEHLVAQLVPEDERAGSER